MAPERPIARRRLRLTLIATALAAVSLLGQILAIHGLSAKGQISSVALILEMAGIFFIPTSLILSAAIIWTARKSLRNQLPLLLLAAINIVIALNFAWFIVGNCSWAHTFGIVLESCQG
jgi:hypothetical protein